MFGMGTGRGPMYMDIPVEPRYLLCLVSVPGTYYVWYRSQVLIMFGIGTARSPNYIDISC